MCVCLGHKGGCGVTDEVAQWMNSVQQGEVVEEAEQQQTTKSAVEHGDSWGIYKLGAAGAGAGAGADRDHSSSWYKYTHEANTEQPAKRKKRATKSDSRTTCSLFIQTDPLMWKHYYESEKRNADSTRKEITSMIAQHVKAVNAIYMDTKFDGRFPHRMTRFEVQRIKIDDYEACEQNYVGEENKFCLPNIDVSNFLNLHSQGNHEDFCLAYVFTYR